MSQLDDFREQLRLAKGDDEGGTTNHWTKPIECQIDANLDSFFSVEKVFNPEFNSAEFDIIKRKAGLNNFRLSAKEWTEKTHAIGIVSKAGRYGGTYAHKDIA